MNQGPIIIAIVIGILGCSKSKQSANIDTLDSLTSAVIPIDTIEVIDTTAFNSAEYEKLESYLAKTEVKTNKLEIVDFDCAILIYPSKSQVDQMKKDYGEDAFYAVADDNKYYQWKAIELIDSVGIKRIRPTKQFIRLEGNSKRWDLDMRKKNLPAWNLIFFKRTKEPVIISTIDLTLDQVKDYFN